jgi:hypothetical protein
VRAFSHVDNTARLLKKEFTAIVDGVAYEPGAAQGIVIVEGMRCINAWTPTRIGRAQSIDAESVKPWTDFLDYLFCVAQDRHHVKKWMSTLIARPQVRMKHGLLMISVAQGVGKGTLMEKILAQLVGWHNVSVPSQKQLIDNDFNSWRVRRRLVLVHEVYAGDSKKAYTNLSSAVTEDTLTVNEKNRPEYEIRNAVHFALSSNSRLALKLVKNDRRWFMPQVTEEKRNEEYWVKFNAWLVSGGLEIIHQWAYEYVAEHGEVGEGTEAPMSAAKEETIELSRSEDQRLVFNLGKVTCAKDKSIVLLDRQVREWLASLRRMADMDVRLPSFLTIGEILQWHARTVRWRRRHGDLQ